MILIVYILFGTLHAGCRYYNHLLFMLFTKNGKEIDSLVRTVRIFSDDIDMQFDQEKCAAITMERGKRVHLDGIDFTR